MLPDRVPDAGSQLSKGCRAPGPSHQRGAGRRGGGQPQAQEYLAADQVSALGQGAGRRVPTVRGVLGAGSQPSEGCWAPGPSHPCTPGAPGCLPTLTFPLPPTQPFLLLPGGNAKRRRHFSATQVLCAWRPGSLGRDQTSTEDWVLPVLWGPEPARSVVIATS